MDNSSTVPRLSYLADGTYHIINVHTGAYAALLNNNDREEMVNITFGLRGDDNEQGSTVSLLLYPLVPS